jgi:hypothetical protein
MKIKIKEIEYNVISIEREGRDQSGSGFSFSKDFAKENKLKEIASLELGFYKICNDTHNEVFEIENDGITFMDSWNDKGGPLSHYLIDISEVEEDKYWEDYADSYFGTEECSSCRGGGCIHCEPSRFI